MNTIIMIIPAEVGSITEMKANRIREVLSSEFNSMIQTGSNVILTGEAKQLVITNNQIQCVINDTVEFDVVNGVFNKLFNLLMIENIVSNATIAINELKENTDAMNFTKQNFKSFLTSSIGVGIREFFVYNGNLSEIKVEPFIEDNSKLYIEARYNLQTLSVNNLKEVLKDIKDDYDLKESELFSKIK